MKRRWYRIGLLALTVLLTAFLTGCSGTSGRGRVYWLNFKTEMDGTLQQLAKRYTGETGTDVKVITAASGTYVQTLIAEMDKSVPPTLYVICNPSDVDIWGKYAADLTDTAIAGELNTDA